MKKHFFPNFIYNKFFLALIFAVITALFSLSIYAENTLNNYYININNKNLTLDIADTPASREKGLMYVERMPENYGMLFILEKPEFVNFWMKNMKIPLDMIFISGEKIVKIYNKVPVCKTLPCEIYPSNCMIDYVLEVNSGYCKKYKIKVGQTVKFSQEVINRSNRIRQN